MDRDLKEVKKEAHGGPLVLSQAIRLEEDQIGHLKEQAVVLGPRALSDLELIANGALSPLQGFMGLADYEGVLKGMHLKNGTLFPFPVTLPLDGLNRVPSPGETLGLCFGEQLVGYLELEEVFERDLNKEALAVFKTDDAAHPGVAMLFGESPKVAAGKAFADLGRLPRPFPEHSLSPLQARGAFQEKGWRTIVGFQTRNPIHRAHEYLIKCALEVVDGAFIHPLIGATKSDDVPAEIRMRCYEVLLESYFPKDRALLGINPATMRYAGPKEAIFHAIVRRNYGCTHFIVGRDHAGVGNFYGPFEAQEVFDTLPQGSLDIQIIKFDNAFYCKACESMTTAKTCPHPAFSHVSLSGTKLRELLTKGEMPGKEITRPEVAQVLIEAFSGK
jgi:sulfate adenylyltransferase